MLIEFRVSNYRSIGEEQVLSLSPAISQKEYPENVISKERFNALKTIAFYGANASGKTNLLRAMNLLDAMINRSAKSSSTTPLPYDPFLLREGWENKPTLFEIVFVTEGSRYRYGIEYLREHVVSEWLFRKKASREVPLFEREGDTIHPSSSFKGSAKIIDASIEATRPNALFLSTCDMLNVEEAKVVLKWFRTFIMIDGLKTEDEEFTTVKLWQDERAKKAVQSYFNKLNFNIIDMEVSNKPFDSGDLPEAMSDDLKASISKEMAGKEGYVVWAKHKIYDKDGRETDKFHTWRMEEFESAGTKKAFHISGPVVAILATGGVLIIDEIEAKMHPIMTLHTINLFLNQETNPKNAQLLFATHDTNILSYCQLRRDQIYFTEKNNWESSEIYSLSDFVYKDDSARTEKERPDSDKEKRYIEGRYGAIPMLGSFRPIKANTNGKKRKG